jgi:RNA polymerase sigma-70 factor (ECF subfamily)
MMARKSPSAADPEASSGFDLLYRAHADAVAAYAARRIPNDAVPDVVAETFAVAWRRLDRVPEHPLPWLLGVARRVASNQRRSQRRREALAVKAAGQVGPAASPDNYAEPNAVLDALRELPERDQDALTLAAWESLSAAEAAQVLGCSATAYRIRLHRARKKLAARLELTASPGEREQTLLPTLRPEDHP